MNIKHTKQHIIANTKVSFKRTKERIEVLNLDSKPALITSNSQNQSLINALIQGHYWKKKQDQNQLSKLLTKSELNHGYVYKLINTTLLSPTVQKLILNGQQPQPMQVQDILKPFPLDWNEQKTHFKLT